MKNIPRRPYRLALTLLLFVYVLPGHSATIVRLGTEELVNTAEVIFEGVVISKRTEMNTNGNIYTFVEFSVEDVLVGNVNAGETLTLRFTGGTVGDLRLDAGVRIPESDERGIYFVERVAPGLINPLLGWEQGHFIVTGNGLVIAGNNRAVQSVETQNRSRTPQISSGVAYGISTGATPAPTTDTDITINPSGQRMSVSEFKQRIREIKD